MRRREVALVPIVGIRRVVHIVGALLANVLGFYPAIIPIQAAVVVPATCVAYITTRIVMEVPRLGRDPLSIKETRHEG